MSRQVILDTETTGLNARLGDRILEIGCVELINRRLTDNHFHRYVNPERDSEEGALKVHGITSEFLADKPKFGEVAQDLLRYIEGAEVIIHNAAFDVDFLDAELGRLKLPPFTQHCAGVFDTLKHARELHPGKRNSLDALCERYKVDNSHRTLHGALLDASLLADVYISMTRGQDSLAIDLEPPVTASLSMGDDAGARPTLRVLAASTEEMAEHEKLLDGIDKDSKGNTLWRKQAAA
ncbi:MAG: DNA polymerase III subunit epsilon [Betaproteobacteria bacterium]|nr:DNA polymerase III subunit epsilon [Betaproteobacteria bacterium]